MEHLQLGMSIPARGSGRKRPHSQALLKPRPDLMAELLALPEPDATSSRLGRTKPARLRRSRIIWPLMLTSSGELEWRLRGNQTDLSELQEPCPPPPAGEPFMGLVWVQFD